MSEHVQNLMDWELITPRHGRKYYRRLNERGEYECVPLYDENRLRFAQEIVRLEAERKKQH